RVIVNTAVTSVSGTPNSCEIGSMISRKIVKSKESSVQPSQAAIQARHWSLVGSFHHGTGVMPATAIVIAHRPVRRDLIGRAFFRRIPRVRGRQVIIV